MNQLFLVLIKFQQKTSLNNCYTTPHLYSSRVFVLFFSGESSIVEWKSVERMQPEALETFHDLEDIDEEEHDVGQGL
jgi:hypothetical protein